MYHPCQLEKRFGGEAESPTNYWPPYIGKHFVPDNFQEPVKFMHDNEEYLEVLHKNPELPVHPAFLNQMNLQDKGTRDFISFSLAASTRADTAMLG